MCVRQNVRDMVSFLSCFLHFEHGRCTHNTHESVRIIRTSFCKAGLESVESVEKNVLQFQSWYEVCHSANVGERFRKIRLPRWSFTGQNTEVLEIMGRFQCADEQLDSE